MFHSFSLILVIFTQFHQGTSDNYSFIDLPSNHLPFYFNSFKRLAEKCKSDDACEHRDLLLAPDYNPNLCWGYEPDCNSEENFYSVPHCPGDFAGYVSSKEAQVKAFFGQTDFGYIKEQIDAMTVMCEPRFPTDSSLECTQYLR
jgi:EGF domain-specific O-GlcNAc transferase